MAYSLPGFQQWCRHQHELLYLAGAWVRTIECSNYYPYGGDSILESEPPEQNSPNWNQQQAIEARERIRSAIADLLDSGTLPTGVRDRNEALRQFGISSQTLYKNLDLWHPNYVDETLKPAPDGVIYPVVDDSTGGRSLKPAPAGVIHPVDTISLSPDLAGAPQEQPALSTEKKAVGESEGFSTATSPPLEGMAAVKALIDRLTHQNQRRRTLPPPDQVIPDEQYFQQLEVALWRD